MRTTLRVGLATTLLCVESFTMPKRVPKSTPASADLPQRVALYLRVSTEDQQERDTIEVQQYFFVNYTKTYDVAVFDTYADDGVSGTLPLDQRPEGRRLLEDATADRFISVVVYKVDRLGRSLQVLMDAYHALEASNVSIRSANEPFDTSTNMGKFLFQLLGSMAELDRSNILERMTLGRDRAARQGKWTTGPVPFGYETDAEGCLIPSTRLVAGVGKTEADLVRELFARMAQGSTAIVEARHWNALGVPTTRYHSNGTTRQGGKRWYPSRVALLIAADVYRGSHVYDSRHGPITRTVPALVDADVWSLANTVRQGNRHLPKGNETRTYLLRGLITCGVCGCAYVGQSVTRLRGKRDLYYRCGTRSSPTDPGRDGRCYSAIVPARWLEDLVWADCRRFILNPGDALAEAQRQLQERQQHAAQHEDERKRYLQAIAEKDQERERIMLLFRRGRLPLDAVERQLEDIAREEAELQKRCRDMDTQRTVAETFASNLTDAQHTLERLQTRLQEVDATDNQTIKRQVIELLVLQMLIDTPEGAPKGKTPYTVTIKYVFSATPTRFAQNGESLPSI